MRRTAILVLLLTAGIAVGLLLLSRGPGRDTAQDFAGSLGLVDDPPFQVRLSGQLWEDRTLISEDGAPEVAYLTHDEGLAVLIAGVNGARVGDVELLVDGRRQRRVRPACPQGRCPTGLRLAFTPRLGTAAGDRRVQVVVRDQKARGPGTDADSHVTTATLTVHIGRRLPLVREGEPVTVTTARSTSHAAGLRGLRTRALQVLSAERRRGVLDPLAGSARLRLSEVGALKANGRPLGATLLFELLPPHPNVTATVPAYIGALRNSGYQSQSVRLDAAVLRDLLVDVDLQRRRVIALEPGPRSQTRVWAPSLAATPAGAADED